MSDLAVRAELRLLYDRLEKASRDGDIEAAVEAVYAPTVTVAGQDSPTVRSREELVPVITGLIGGGARLKVTSMFDGPQVLGDTAYDFILNEVSLPENGGQMVGKSLVVWRRGPAGWRCVADMFAMGTY